MTNNQKGTPKMSLLKLEDEKEIKKAETQSQEQADKNQERWAIAIILIVGGTGYGLTSGHSLFESLEMVVGSFILAIVVGLIASKFTTKWHLPFVLGFLVIFGIHFFVSRYKENLNEPADFNKQIEREIPAL